MADWRVIVGEPQTAAEQMACDARLAEDPVPTVRLFTWSPPALSLGWKQPRPDWLRGDRWATSPCEVVERPTGGGIAFHGSDLSLAVVIPRTSRMPLETLMRAVCQSAVTLCRAYGANATVVLEAPSAGRSTYCLTEMNPYAVVVGTRKVAGFALRRYPTSWLIQGSLLVQSLPRVLAEAIPPDVRQQVEVLAIPLGQVTAAPVSASEAAARWADHWSDWWPGATRARHSAATSMVTASPAAAPYESLIDECSIVAYADEGGKGTG